MHQPEKFPKYSICTVDDPGHCAFEFYDRFQVSITFSSQNHTPACYREVKTTVNLVCDSLRITKTTDGFLGNFSDSCIFIPKYIVQEMRY